MREEMLAEKEALHEEQEAAKREAEATAHKLEEETMAEHQKQMAELQALAQCAPPSNNNKHVLQEFIGRLYRPIE